jgi:cytidylate kinase
LKKADDAILLDNSSLSVDEQVDFVIRKAQEILAANAGNH